jgi:uncharacterized protein YbjT (DUF2867 family)
VSVLVTGATGFIGRRLLERLLAREGDVHALPARSPRPGSSDLRGCSPLATA